MPSALVNRKAGLPGGSTPRLGALVVLAAGIACCSASALPEVGPSWRCRPTSGRADSARVAAEPRAVTRAFATTIAQRTPEGERHLDHRPLHLRAWVRQECRRRGPLQPTRRRTGTAAAGRISGHRSRQRNASRRIGRTAARRPRARRAALSTRGGGFSGRRQGHRLRRVAGALPGTGERRAVECPGSQRELRASAGFHRAANPPTPRRARQAAMRG
jgi:hypothetical protein